MSHFCRPYRSGTKAFLCNALHFYTDSKTYTSWIHTECAVVLPFQKMVKRRCHNVMLRCTAYVVPLVWRQYLSLYPRELETACHVTLEVLVAVDMNKEPYTTNRRVQLLWNSSTAVLHRCNPTAWTHLHHERGEMESLDIQRFRSHSRLIDLFMAVM
jgi:hypothetical protein